MARLSIHERTLAVVEGFYDAALDESLWPAALRQLTELTRSQAASSNTVRDDVIQQNPRTAVAPVNPLFDPAVPHICDNLVVVHAAIGGAEPNLTLEIDITDVTIQHRAAKVWNDQLNAVVQKGSQQQINNASQQALPKF